MQSTPEKTPKLPARISKIVVQTRNKSRFSLYNEEKFIIGVSDQTIVHFKLKIGTQIDHELYQKLIESEKNWKVREYLLTLLSRRDHASYELKLKALKKGYETTHIDDSINSLEQKGYIDNDKFARKFTHDKFEFNKWGPEKIKAELLKKRIDIGSINLALESVKTESKIGGALSHLALKRKARILREPPEKRKKKLFDFLIRKGYDYSDISKEIDRLLKHIES